MTLIRGGNVIFEEAGEVQFRKYGISGIVTFNASRYAQKGDVIYLDFTEPCLIDDNKKEHFRHRFVDYLTTNPYSLFPNPSKNDPYSLIPNPLDVFFKGFLHNDLVKLIKSRIKNKDSFEELWEQISAFKLTVKELYEDEKLSQVSRGGIQVSDLDPQTLQVQDGNIYACGEVIDVDGPCGGYNLTWAFESGWRAGKCAAMSLRS